MLGSVQRCVDRAFFMHLVVMVTHISESEREKALKHRCVTLGSRTCFGSFSLKSE